MTSLNVWCMGGSSCRGPPGVPSLLPAFTCAGASKPLHSSAHSTQHPIRQRGTSCLPGMVLGTKEAKALPPRVLV